MTLGARLEWGKFGEHPLFRHDALQGFVNVSFDVRNRKAFIFVRKGDRRSCVAGATRTTNAVHIIFGFVGEVVVDDELDVVHMDTTACHIGGHHRANVARAEGFQDLQTLHLVHIAREHFAGDSTATQSFADAFGRELAVTEDDRASTRMLG